MASLLKWLFGKDYEPGCPCSRFDWDAWGESTDWDVNRPKPPNCLTNCPRKVRYYQNDQKERQQL